MSQLVRAIMATNTGKQRIIDDSFSSCFKDVFYSKEELSKTNQHEIASIYRIEARFASEELVTDMQLQKSTSTSALEGAVLRAKQYIVQAVFGEFREDFYLLQKAIYDRDFAKSKELLTNFERKMFSVE